MRTLTMTKRLVKQIVEDKRTLALLLVAPIFVLYLLSIILNSSIDKPILEVINVPASITDPLEKEATITSVDDENAALDKVKDREIDGLLVYKDSTLTVTVEGSDPSLTGAVKKAVSKATGESMKTTFESLASNPKLPLKNFSMLTTEFNFINGSEDMSTFNSIAPLMMGFFIFFFVFLLAGISFLRERLSGTLDRLIATPIKRMEIVLGYFFGFGIFVMLQTIIIQLFMIYGLGIQIKGSFYVVLLINVVLAAGSLSLGTLLSAFARNEFQLFQFIPIIIVPQILFCGMFNLREAPIWVTTLSKIFPMTYGADALRSVILRGATFSDISLDVLILVGYALLFIGLNSLALKKYRRL
ncbi:MAG: ABC transporter permease [Clostridiaceae bacterium]